MKTVLKKSPNNGLLRIFYIVFIFILGTLITNCGNKKQEERLIGEIGYSHIHHENIDTSTVYLDLKENDTLSFWSLASFGYMGNQPSINYIIEMSYNNELVETRTINALKFHEIVHEKRYTQNGKSYLEVDGKNLSFPIFRTGEYKLFCTFKFENEEEFNLERLKFYFKRSN